MERSLRVAAMVASSLPSGDAGTSLFASADCASRGGVAVIVPSRDSGAAPSAWDSRTVHCSGRLASAFVPAFCAAAGGTEGDEATGGSANVHEQTT